MCEWHSEWDALPAEEQARLAARQGQGYAVFDLVRVVDDDMRDVPRDGETMGEVVMRGNNVMKGYYEHPEATAEAFRGGWFHSGDIGVLHPDGYIELRDRKKDIIISGGENISTIEVEHAVVSIPPCWSARWSRSRTRSGASGRRPSSRCSPAPQATEAEIIEFCRERSRTSSARRPSSSASCPKTSTGKIQKFVLRDKEWGGRAKRIN